jgi:molybdopterin-binding protein
VRRRFREDLRRVVSGLSATVIIITHEHNEALALAQRVAVINEGRIVQVGTTADVFTSPQNAFVADFTGAETIWRGDVIACGEGLCHVRTKAVDVDILSSAGVGTEVALAIRPEDVALSLAGQGTGAQLASGVRNGWSGVVGTVTPAGPLMRVLVNLDGSRGVAPLFGGEGEVIALITKASAEELGIAPGLPVIASVKATALHVLRD